MASANGCMPVVHLLLESGAVSQLVQVMCISLSSALSASMLALCRT